MKPFIYIFLFAVVAAGCSDNQATVEEESKTTVNRKKGADELQSNTIKRDIDDEDVDTIGMAEFLALKATVARQGSDLTDENDPNVDTTGFSAYKRSKAKTARRPCDREDSIIAERKNKSRNSKTRTTERSTQQSESRDEGEISEEVEVDKDSTTVNN